MTKSNDISQHFIVLVLIIIAAALFLISFSHIGISWFIVIVATIYALWQAGKQVKLQNVGQWYATMPKDELEAFMQKNEGLRRDWDEQYGDRMQKLVFIGQHLDKELIAKELNDCLV